MVIYSNDYFIIVKCVLSLIIILVIIKYKVIYFE